MNAPEVERDEIMVIPDPDGSGRFCVAVVGANVKHRKTYSVKELISPPLPMDVANDRANIEARTRGMEVNPQINPNASITRA
jgi:hypothetical protein